MSLYEYTTTVLRVVDGDTIDVITDLGFDVRMNMRLRLYGINAPEMKTPEGQAARAWLDTQIPPATVVTIRTVKDKKEKYGRYLAKIFLASDPNYTVNDRMVEAGHAVRYMGG